MVTPIFQIWTYQQKSPRQVYVISTTHTPLAIPQNNPRKRINLAIEDEFSQFQASSVTTI